MTPAQRAAFRKPFAAQVEALRLRLGNRLPTAAWDDLWQDQHARAFVVAGAMKADLLADLAEAVRAAVEDGETLEAFRARFRTIVETRGWHGWTGEGTARGEAWRTRVIYRTNMATSWAAGRMAQLVQLDYRYWVYRHGGSREPRLQHLAWDGLILPPDHPFWQTHAPPNGWGCSCRIRGARTLDGAVRKGGKPGLDLPPNWAATDPRTGAPPGIDKGWGYGVGRSTADELAALLRDKAARLPPPLAADLAAAMSARIADLDVPSPETPDEAITLGRRALAALLRAPVEPSDPAGGPGPARRTLGDLIAAGGADAAAPQLRRAITRALGEVRETGTVRIAVGQGARTLRELIRPVEEAMPSAWVAAANRVKVDLSFEPGRGRYVFGGGAAPRILANGESVAHEYLHHLQQTLDGLDALFVALHRRRTAGAPLVDIGHGEPGRPDGYYRTYQGREYPGFGAMEVLTMALEPILGRGFRHDRQFEELLTADPEMLEFALGVLFFWKPR